jgi:hypothetical protein
LFTAGESTGSSSDKYVRPTVFLASVLFPLRVVRHALIVPGAVALIVSLVQLTPVPAPPGTLGAHMCPLAINRQASDVRRRERRPSGKHGVNLSPGEIARGR